MQSIKAHSGVASLRFKTRKSSAPRTRHRGGGGGMQIGNLFLSLFLFVLSCVCWVHSPRVSWVNSLKSLYSFFFGKPRRGKSINLTLFSTRQNFFTWEKNALENQDEAFASSCLILATPMKAHNICCNHTLAAQHKIDHKEFLKAQCIQYIRLRYTCTGIN